MNILPDIIRLVYGGLMIAIERAVSSGVMITIIGRPFGLRYFKLMELALLPFGKAVN